MNFGADALYSTRIESEIQATIEYSVADDGFNNRELGVDFRDESFEPFQLNVNNTLPQEWLPPPPLRSCLEGTLSSMLPDVYAPQTSEFWYEPYHILHTASTQLNNSLSQVLSFLI